MQVSLNLVNAFNATPPANHSCPGTTSTPHNVFNYDVYGRSLYLGVQYRVRK